MAEHYFLNDQKKRIKSHVFYADFALAAADNNMTTVNKRYRNKWYRYL